MGTDHLNVLRLELKMKDSKGSETLKRVVLRKEARRAGAAAGVDFENNNSNKFQNKKTVPMKSTWKGNKFKISRVYLVGNTEQSLVVELILWMPMVNSFKSVSYFRENKF